MKSTRILIIQELENQVSRFENRFEKLKKLSRKISLLRLAIFLIGTLLFFLFFFLVNASAALLSTAVFLTAFGITVMQHNKIDFEIKRTHLWINFKKEDIARIKVNWDGIPYRFEAASDDDHPFEADLNITGKHSLMHLVNVSSSREGTDKLRDYLTNYLPDLNLINERQELVKELTLLPRFRNKLRLNSFFAYDPKKENILAEQLKSTGELSAYKRTLLILGAIISVNVILFLLYLIFHVPAYFAFGLLVHLGVYWFNLKLVDGLYDKSMELKDDFGKFSRIFEFLENYPYKSNSKLKERCSKFLDKSNKPSQKMHQVNRIIYAVSLQNNFFTKLMFNLVFPWDFFFAYKLEKLKGSIAAALPAWLDSWYNLEALVSLANIAAICPDYTFPSLHLETNTNHLFTLENAGHPLIPEEQSVRNSFNFNSKGECIIITGSNMSGKSTFLRTLGVNLALCYAGGPVCCSKMSVTLLRIYTCIKVSDSVTDGISYFYAEVKRLKKLLNELTQPNKYHLFFLIDEIFRGTNNLERLTGSRAYIKKLAGGNSIGLISTHDLELIKLSDETPLIKNYHFKEEVIGDKMVFDYKIHEGPCPTTNALKIMKLEGLPVE